MNASNFFRFTSNTTRSLMFCSSLGFSPSSIFGSLISKSLISLTTTSMDDRCLNNFARIRVLLGKKSALLNEKATEFEQWLCFRKRMQIGREGRLLYFKRNHRDTHIPLIHVWEFQRRQFKSSRFGMRMTDTFFPRDFFCASSSTNLGERPTLIIPFSPTATYFPAYLSTSSLK